MEIKDKIILVTGGSAGIGLETAIQLQKKGAKLIITGRDKSKLEAVEKKYGFDARVCDVSDEDAVLSMFSYISEKYDHLDVLVNNAGFGKFSLLQDQTAEMLENVLATNVKGAMLMAREASKIFIRQNSGAIINISSTAGTKGFAGGTAYVASKFALKGMTECWRAELRPHNVRVILINPSEVQTNFGDKIRESYNPSKLLSEDIAFSIVSALEMNDRGFITELTVFATNPKN